MSPNQERIGTRLTADATRDAVHIAVLPVIADAELWPGMPVALVSGTTDRAGPATQGPSIGVVDPFLQGRVAIGERCFVFIHPNTVTGMRHVWTHPHIDGVRLPTSDSERWLMRFAEKWNFNYDALITNAQESGGYVVADGIDLHSAGDLGADHDLFWSHLENVTGRTFGVEHRERFGWSCAC